MSDQVAIQEEPPWVVEIDGTKFATPELVCLLLQDVSEERDQLKANDIPALLRVVRAAEEALPECWDTPTAERILREALEALPEHLRGKSFEDKLRDGGMIDDSWSEHLRGEG